MSIEKIISTLPLKSNAERDRIRVNAQRLLADGKPAQKVDAEKVIVALDDLAESEHRTRYERLKDAPVSQRVIEAFQAEPPTDTEVKVIRALLANPHATSAALSDACGWRGQVWHAHFGAMCRAREVWLWPAERSVLRDSNFWSGILADFDAETSTWTMKPDVAAAFCELGLAPGTVS